MKKTLIILSLFAATGCKTQCPTCNPQSGSSHLKMQKVEDPQRDFEYGWNAAIDSTIHSLWANENENEN